MQWQAAAAKVRWNIQPFIGGSYRSSRATASFERVNPASEITLYHASVGDAGDVDEAVRAARLRIVQGGWSDLPATRRADALMKLADLLVQHKAEIALLDSLEVGKPIQASLYDAEIFAPGFLRAAAGFADKLNGRSGPADGARLSLNAYEPRGVVGLITPWNFPIVNVAIKLAPALAAGNTVVIKPSELSSASALKLAELSLEAGIPDGVINVVPGLGSTTGAALARHPDVDLISFTGSTITGRRVMSLAGESGPKPILLECGGKCPHIVFDDVMDLDRLARVIVRGFTWNQGQVCSAHTRLIVQKGLSEELTSRIVEIAQRITPADPLEESTTFGPLASVDQRERVRRYVEEATARGARARLRGDIRLSGGCYVSPTIFDQVDASMPVVREEIFGPVLCVQSFETESEALELANDSHYGLEATVWTRDLGRALTLARAVRAGYVSIRTGGEEQPPSGAVLSHEPQKASGFGSETGIGGLERYSTLKFIRLSGG